VFFQLFWDKNTHRASPFHCFAQTALIVLYKIFYANVSFQTIHGLDFETGYKICSVRFYSFLQAGWSNELQTA